MAERRLEDYEKDLIANVGDKAVRDIVNDFKNYNPSPSMGKAAKVRLEGAGRVIDGDDVKRGTTGSNNGWQEAPSTSNWRPPGLSHMDRMMDEADALDRAQRAAQLVEAARALKALAEAEQELKAEKADPTPSVPK
jgi:hypothetical protein